METSVDEKLPRYQKYLEKCLNDGQVNEKHVCESICFYHVVNCAFKAQMIVVIVHRVRQKKVAPYWQICDQLCCTFMGTSN